MILFGTAPDVISKQFRITMGRGVINSADVVKDLGFYLDNSLRFRSHINYVTQKGFMALRNLYRSRSFLDTQMRTMLHVSLVLCFGNYGLALLGPCLDQQSLAKLQKLQNSCEKYIFRIARMEHCTPLC
nr:unnamed protein product [Callosobruchus analis]